jgi:Flavodoxins
MTKSLIVVYSYHHNNTARVADSMAEALGCEVEHLGEIADEDISNYDMIGFGAGIDSGKHYAPLLEFAQGLQMVQDKKAFIFSTCAVLGTNKVRKNHAALHEILVSKGYRITDEFACKGYNTNSFLKHIGGMNKGNPNADDLQNAADFARNLTVKEGEEK